MSKKKIAYFYDADVGNYYYGQVSDNFFRRTRSGVASYSIALKLHTFLQISHFLSRATL